MRLTTPILTIRGFNPALYAKLETKEKGVGEKETMLNWTYLESESTAFILLGVQPEDFKAKRPYQRPSYPRPSGQGITGPWSNSKVAGTNRDGLRVQSKRREMTVYVKRKEAMYVTIQNTWCFPESSREQMETHRA